MNKITERLLSIALSAMMVYSCFPAVSAEEEAETEADTVILEQEVQTEEQKEYEYIINGAGTVTDAYYRALGSATDFYRYNCEKNGVAQAVYAVYTDPSRGGYMKGIELGDGFGQKGRVSRLTVDSEGDERLLAAVNADFFSVATGVPLGVFVEDGRFISSSDGHYAIGFDENGNAFLGKTDEKITLLRGEEELPIEYLNKFATIFGVYLITEDFGKTVRDTVESNEYIISLSDELKLGGKIECEVLEIRRGDANGNIPEGCGVLIVPDEFMYCFNYVFEVGDKFEISVSANEEFCGAVNVIGGGDIILFDGVIADNINDESLETSRNPRTSMGITADGELVFTVVDGRQAGYSSGVTMTALAEIMMSLGCIHAINLDGGGSSVMALFDSGKGNIVNSPSDKSERAVPNALAIYESREKTADSYYLSVSQPETMLLSGSVTELEISLKKASGEDSEILITDENTVILCDGEVGNVEFADGKFFFTAGGNSCLGKLRVETKINGESVFADIFVNVTDTVDEIIADSTVIFSDGDAEQKITVNAYRGQKKVYYGDFLDVYSEEPAFVIGLEGEDVYVSMNPQGTDDNSAFGEINITLLDKSIVIPAYFEDSLSVVLDGILADSVSVSREGYTVSYDEKGGVSGEGAFVIQSPEKPQEIHEEEPAEPILPSDGEDKLVDFFEPDAEIGGEPVTETEEEQAEPEIIPAVEPFNVEISGEKLVSGGFSGRKLWVWVDGLEKGSEPYAVIEVYGDDGKAKEQKIAYDAFYDFTAYNERALLVLDFDFEGTVALKTLLGYTAFDEEQRVEAGPFVLSEEYDTNLYHDTENHWSSYYVNSLSYMGIVGGSEDIYGKLVYIPDDGLSREQFAKILVNYLKIDVSEYSETELNFADSDEIAPWAVPYVKAAVGAGLMKGRTTPADTVIFAPNDGIKRQEAIYVLGGLLPEVEGSEISFTDKDEIAPWAAENFSRALSAGLISGYDDGSIRPEGGITRGEAATLVVRLYNFSSKS